MTVELHSAEANSLGCKSSICLNRWTDLKRVEVRHPGEKYP